MIQINKIKKNRLLNFKKLINQSKGSFLAKKFTSKIFKHNKIFLTSDKNLFFILRQKTKKTQKYYYKYYTNSSVSYNNLYIKFINLIFKQGQKSFWEKKIASLFFILKKKLNYSRNYILLKIFLRLHTKVEIRTVKSRKRVNIIPFFIKLKRRYFLALKWLLSSAKAKKASFQQNLLLEILLVLNKKTSVSLSLLKENNLLSYKNRANMHFRW